MSSELITVIIPTFNREHYLADAIESVINQTYSNWELIIVDDGSADNTVGLVNEFIEKHPNIRFLIRPETEVKGANTCRNIGLKEAKGSLIKWLDSDDILHREILAMQSKLLLESKDDNVCFCQFSYFKKNASGMEIINKPWCRILTSEHPIADYINKKLRWATPAGLWRRSCLPEKPFQEALMNSQEWLMHLKFLLNDIGIVTTPETGGYVRVHEGSMSNKKHKGGLYYYHQCYSRFLAIKAIASSNHNKWVFKFKLAKFIGWNYLFIVYKGNFSAAIRFLKYLPALLVNLLFR